MKLFQDYENYTTAPRFKYCFTYTTLSTVESFGKTTTYFMNINSDEDLSGF